MGLETRKLSAQLRALADTLAAQVAEAESPPTPTLNLVLQPAYQVGVPVTVEINYARTGHIVDWGDTTTTPAGTSVSHTYTASGTFPITIKENGQVITGTDVRVAPIVRPIPQVTPTPATAQAGQVITFDFDRIIPGDQFSYGDNSPLVTAVDGLTHTYAQGEYTAQVIRDGQPVPDAVPAVIKVTAAAPATLVLTIPNPMLTGMSVSALIGSTQPGDKLNWGEGPDIEVTDGTYPHTYNASGPYDVTLKRGATVMVSQRVTVSTPVIGITYDPPIKVTAATTLTRNYQSLDPLVPAVLIETTQPVTIEGSIIQSKGDCIRNRTNGGQTIIRNVKTTSLNPDKAGVAPGRAADLQGQKSILVENNDFSVGTVYVLKYTGNKTSDTFIIRRNRIRDINGQYSNGAGGYEDRPFADNRFRRSQAVQFNAVVGIPGARVEWNWISNEPRISHVEDNISIYKSEGKSDTDRIIVQRNLIDGAYARDPADEHTGSAIALGDQGGRWLSALFNVAIETSNSGIFASDGNDILIADNVLVAIGRLPDGTYLDKASDWGIYVRAYTTQATRQPSTVIVERNTLAWNAASATNASNRKDIGIGKFSEATAYGAVGDPLGLARNNIIETGTVTEARKQAARDLWQSWAAAQSFTIGRPAS